MERWGMGLVLVLVGAPWAGAVQNRSQADDERQVIQLLRDIYSAIQRKDEAFLRRTHADEHVVIQRQGAVKTRDQWLAEIRSGDTSFTELAALEPRIRI